MKENLVSLKDKGENMATIANQGDISYLMPQLKTVMMFLFNNMVEQLNADENGHPESFSFELNPDNPNRDNIVVGTAEIVDWIRNQEKMVQQAKMIDELGVGMNDKGSWTFSYFDATNTTIGIQHHKPSFWEKNGTIKAIN